MIKINENVFFITTETTEYIFRISTRGYLEHIYYGQRLDILDITPLEDKYEFTPGNMITIEDRKPISLEFFRTEYSTKGKGDVREVMLDISHGDGSRTSEFIYDSHEIFNGKYKTGELPSSYAEEQEAVTSLKVKLIDKNSNTIMNLLYGCFEKSNIITKSLEIINKDNEPIVIQKCLSNQLDLGEFKSYDFISFHGHWINEMNQTRRPILPGGLVNTSYCGSSSNRVNPFCMISERDATEEHGDVYGFNLIYSGNHYESVNADISGRIRFLQGINVEEFQWILNKDEFFVAPEAVMSFSSNGFQEISKNMHMFVNQNIVRGPWKQKERPILINSWESFYFDINEKKLYDLAKQSSNLGIELFVIDDGWFEGRNDDTSSLGDWKVDSKKFPKGLKHFGDKINKLGMELGIWVEPEMVNENSQLYRNHPEYVVSIPGQEQALGRNQMFLNLTMYEVQEYIINSLRALFQSAKITYVKWDMNRVFSDVYANNLSKDQQLEFPHRYILGLYRVLDVLTKEFPEILFENCASGGNRFDLGMLCYMQQSWASDNTDPRCRIDIQSGYSYGYPSSVIGAHVSQSPNHQTLRKTLIDTRFDVAAFGVLGYECDFKDCSSFELSQIKEQILFYKKYRKIFQYGDFYRIKNNENHLEWMVFDKERDQGIILFYKKQVIPGSAYDHINFKGVNEDHSYVVKNRKIFFSIKEVGSLINAITPIHIRMNSPIHNILDRVKHMESEVQETKTSGKVMIRMGMNLNEGFACRGFNENIRFMSDNGTRMYVVGNSEKSEG